MAMDMAELLAERIKQRSGVTPAKINVRYVKFTPEEMTIDAGYVDASKGPFIARGTKEWEDFLSFRRGFVRLDPEIRKAFRDDRSVNEALKKFIVSKQSASRRKRSA